jgi:ArsR family metal-binding transcriptional regulator
MLIEKYDLEVFTPPCEPGAERYAAIARLTADISEVLPYLNATLRGAVYLQSANALTWEKGDITSPFTLTKSGLAMLKTTTRRAKRSKAWSTW